MVNLARMPAAARLGLIMLALTLGQTVVADDYSSAWGPAVGDVLPMLDAPDHTGTPRNLDNLTGKHGLLLFLVRSADW